MGRPCSSQCSTSCFFLMFALQVSLDAASSTEPGDCDCMILKDGTKFEDAELVDPTDQKVWTYRWCKTEEKTAKECTMSADITGACAVTPAAVVDPLKYLWPILKF